MANLIVNASDFSPATQMIYGKPNINKKGGKSINILNSTTKKWLTLHTPMMMTYGVNQRVNDDGTINYDMSLQFPRDEFSNKETQQLKTMMMEMEEKIIQDAFVNSRDWFGKKYSSIDVLRELWSPMLKFPKNKDDGSTDTTRPPTLKVKLPIYKRDGKDDIKFDLFDTKSQSIFPNEEGQTPDELVQKGANVWCVITSGGIWFANGKFGVTWKLNQAVVKPPDTFEKGKCYVSVKSDAYDSDGEEAPTEKVKEKVETPAPEPPPSVAETPAEASPEAHAEPPAEVKEEVKEKPVKKATSKKTAS